MTEQILFLNEQRVDLDDDTKIALTIQANDIAELQDRQANFTQSFTLPITDNNRRIVEASEQVFSGTFLPYRQIKAKVVASGIEVISDGIAIIEEAEKKYRLSVYSGLTDFFKKIDGLNLADIDFTTVNLPRFIDNRWTSLFQLWTAAATADVILPLYQTGFINDNNRVIRANDHNRPAVSFRKIIEAIFTFGEYTFDGSIFNDSRLERLFLPIVEQKLKYSDQFIKCFGYAKMTLQNELVLVSIVNDLYARNLPDLFQPLVPPESNDPTNFVTTPFAGIASSAYTFGIDNGTCDNNSMLSFSLVNNQLSPTYYPPESFMLMQGLPQVPTYPRTIFRASVAGKYVVTVRGKVFHRATGDVLAGVSYWFVKASRFNGVISNNQVLVPCLDNVDQNNTYFEYDFKLEVETFLFKDEPLWITLEDNFLSVLSFSYPNQYEYGFTENTTFEVKLKSDSVQFGLVQSTATHEAGVIDLAGNLPNLSMKNFLKAFAQMFGLILIPDAQAKNIRFVQFKEVVSNRTIARDWSDKIVDDTFNLKFRLNEYGQTNKMKYLEDENVAPEYGDSFFAIDDQNLSSSKDVITLPFAASEQTFSCEGLSMSEILFKDFNGDTLKPKPRVLYAYKNIVDASSSDFQFNVYDQNNNLWNSVTTKEYFKTYFIDGNEASSLGFNNSLIEENYLELIDSLQRAKIVTIELLLTATDVANFDFAVPVYFRQFAAYFYVNKISNWIDGKSCKVELVRIA
jgi:hypothetical protein